MNPEDIPPTALQFMVEMSCGKCVAAVESAVAAVAGVEAVTAALDTNTVRVVARLQQSDDVIHAITQKGYKCRLIGSGDVEGFGEDLAVRLGTDLRTLRQSLAAVAEFKGEVYGHGDVAGVVRFVAVNESTCLVEGAVQGLVPHGKYAVTVRTYGDTTRGVASTGGVYDCEKMRMRMRMAPRMGWMDRPALHRRVTSGRSPRTRMVKPRFPAGWWTPG